MHTVQTYTFPGAPQARIDEILSRIHIDQPIDRLICSGPGEQVPLTWADRQDVAYEEDPGFRAIGSADLLVVFGGGQHAQMAGRIALAYGVPVLEVDV